MWTLHIEKSRKKKKYRDLMRMFNNMVIKVICLLILLYKKKKKWTKVESISEKNTIIRAVLPMMKNQRQIEDVKR